MPFKVKDLMISDLSAEHEPAHHPLCAVFQISCLDKSAVFSATCKVPHTMAGEYAVNAAPNIGANYFFLKCDLSVPDVDVGVTITPLTPKIEKVSVGKTTLADLKDQLKRQLAHIEQHEAAAQENFQPKNVEEIDHLTKKLTEAVEDLKARRAELSKK